MSTKSVKASTERMQNFTPGKTLRQYKPGDSLYISKKIGGFQFVCLCEFVRIERGIVWARVVKNERGQNMGGARPGDMETARASSCFAWGKNSVKGIEYPYCQWFMHGLDKPAGLILSE